MRPNPPPLAELVGLLPESVCVVDAGGTLLYVNDAFEGLLGYTRDEFIGRCIFELVHPDDREETLDQARRVTAGEAQRHFRNRYLHKDGHSVDLLWSARWLPQYGVRLGVAREINELRRVEEELAHRAHHDPLTGLPNRRSLHDAFDRLRIAATRSGTPLSVLYLDLDGFKRINDRLGHAAGDVVLEEVARRLRAALRQGDFVARVGGDEFVALLPGCDTLCAGTVCASLMRSLHAPFSLRGQSVSMDASVGIASHPADGRDLGPLLVHADTAMFAVKRARKPATD
ncbi:MAG: diguanylate cyclase [Lysobacter sp.]|nr:MAG: diguanylate cyclase [Lysobacter sp.]